MPVLSFAINICVALLLCVTIIYCYRLDRRLSALRSGQDGLKDVIAGLDRATERAQYSLAELKNTGVASENVLQAAITHAESLADELRLMVQSADRVADRLAQSRPGNAAAPTAPVQRPVNKDTERAPIFDALRQAR